MYEFYNATMHAEFHLQILQTLCTNQIDAAIYPNHLYNFSLEAFVLILPQKFSKIHFG